MSTRAPGSEKALADLVVQELTDTGQPRVLIGGLGLGFTLGAALDVLPRGASVVVVEFFETIVDWNRKFGFESATDRLADPRVVVEVTDVVDYLGEVKRPFDAILLDVDNGPDTRCLVSNERLYDRPGLSADGQEEAQGVAALHAASDLRRGVLDERRYCHVDRHATDRPPRTWARVPSRTRHTGHQVRAVNLNWSVRA